MLSAFAESGALLAAHWKLILTIAYLAWAVAVIVALILARRSSAATLAWALALLALPYVGAAIYLFFGPRRLHRKKLRYAHARRQIRQVAPGLGTTVGGAMGEAIRVRYRQLARLATELGQPAPLRADEPVTLYIDGDDCYAAIEAAIRAATDHVHLEYYIWDPGRAGDRLRDALAERARAGVKVRLLLDDVGSDGASDDYFATLTRAGGELAWFNPLRISRFRPTLLNFRTHRKIVVVDGRIGFIGGMNVSDVQSSDGSVLSGTRARGDRLESPLEWRDTHMRIVGAPVGALQRVFLDDWSFAFGTCKVEPTHFPASERDPTGPSVQIIASGPDDSVFAIQQFKFAAIASSRQSLSITTPYLVPDEATLSALKSAALRGVNVRLLVPKQGDSKLVTAAGRSYYDELVAAGVVLFEYGPAMLHAKTMVIDDTVAVVGTANLDNRSFRLNFEVIAVVYDVAAAGQLGAIFDQDLRSAVRYRPPTGKRPIGERLMFGIARLVSPLL
jgi:cardiolipin synthase